MPLPRLLLPILTATALGAAGPTLSQVQEKRLSNGLRVVVLEQPGSGQVRAQLVFRDGSEVWGARPQAGAWVARALLGPLPRTDLAPDSALEGLIQRLEGATEALTRLRTRQARLGEADPGLEDLAGLESRLRAELAAKVDALPDAESEMGLVRGALSVEPDGITQGTTLPVAQLGPWLRLEKARLERLRLTRLPLLPDVPAEEDRQVLDLALATAFPGHPVSPACPAGSRPTLSEARALAQQLTSRDRTALVLAGDVQAAEAFDLAERELGSLPAAPPWTSPVGHPEPAPGVFGGRRLSLVWERAPRLVVAWPMPPADHRDFDDLRWTADLLGEGPDALLHRRLVVTGLAREVRLQWIHQGASSPGLLVVQVFPEEGRGLTEVALALEAEIRRFLLAPLTPSQLERRVRRSQLLEALQLDEPAVAADALAAAWRRSGDWRRAFAPPPAEGGFELSAAARRAFHPDRKTELLLEANPESALRDPLDRKLAEALRRLAMARGAEPATVEAQVAQALRQLRMLSRQDREATLKVLEGSGGRR